ncbi:HPP family protein [Acidianus manzaensis]|uniref:HPP family protein n=1 Tax=Acidianus manzaensis TaxID=282676 RepID=A0A1W6JX07_9CREN|nr:HPP family protein [Acidianus manzaensis]ARM74785.1 HPP family protein [Acidianus manzaensis]
MYFPSKKKKIISIINLIISISLLVAITVYTRTEFILPPFLATAATKYPDPEWRRYRSYNILISYLLSGAIAVIFCLFGLYGLTFGVLASFISFIIEVVVNIEHPPSILASLLGVLEKVNPLYLIHPILSGVIVVEGINYLLTKYVEPKI